VHIDVIKISDPHGFVKVKNALQAEKEEEIRWFIKR
jgi:hypothetical protein